MNQDETCYRCGIEREEHFLMAFKGLSYCPECYYAQMMREIAFEANEDYVGLFGPIYATPPFSSSHVS